jgi:hypothetical protein
MRLLRTWTAGLELEELSQKHLRSTKYAILSHTWGEEEILFEDIGKPGIEGKKGYRKVQLARRQADRDDLNYIWIDTCCIDKSSSAELSEAINSMYAWYRDAAACYAYLSDVLNYKDSLLMTSKWFTRGWTLQELLAPKDVTFFTSSWKPIGRRSELHKLIFTITGIDSTILTGRASVDSASIARRMSWAAHRDTTRLEDMAYCLMGIFSVNMPMLYGEGSRAFQRLQEEIAKQSDDPTLFAWYKKDTSIYKSRMTHGLLADSPAEFAGSAGMVACPGQTGRVKIATTNEGLRIEVGLEPTRYGYIATLGCMDLLSKDFGKYVAIFLEAVSAENNQFTRRIEGDHLLYRKERGPIQEIYVPTSSSSETDQAPTQAPAPSNSQAWASKKPPSPQDRGCSNCPNPPSSPPPSKPSSHPTSHSNPEPGSTLPCP